MVKHDQNANAQLPYTIPHDWVKQGGKREAQMVFYSHTKIYWKYIPAKTMDVYEVIEISSGEVVSICPPRLSEHPSNGTIKLNAAEGVSKCVRKQVGWLTATATAAAPVAASIAHT
jgi:hypothetical protein